MALRKTPREKALGVVEAFDAHAARWAAERDLARSDLVALEATLGEAALAEPIAAASLPRQMQELRDRALVAEQAFAAAGVNALAARRDALRHEADELAAPIEAAREALEAHESRTVVLLAALQGHTGEDYTPASEMQPWDPSQAFEAREVKVPARWALADTLAALERARTVLLAVADGRDPREVAPGIGVSELPQSVQPGGLLPAPGFVAEPDQAAGFAAELVEAQSRLDEAQSRVDELEVAGGAGLVEAQRALKHAAFERDNCAGYVTSAA
jgi:hypothetical protein